jgi:ferric-chelate reductase
VFFNGRLFESHPLTILNAPAPVSNISSRTLTLGSRAVGDWSRALHAYARREGDLILSAMGSEKLQDGRTVGVPVQVMIDGPYGGCSIDLGEYESVLLFGGGSGVTFILGMLDDIVGRVVRLGRKDGERTKRIEFAWCIRSFGGYRQRCILPGWGFVY